MTQTYRWGIIGCGAVTEVKSGPAYQDTPGFELHAVMRRDGDRAADYARRHQVPLHFSNADELICHPQIDAVYIATPPDSHLHYARKVAAAGKPCCIEKPLAPGYEQALEIQQCFNQKSLPVFVAYYRRSLPRFLKVRELLQAGVIGEPRHISWQLHRTPSAQDFSGAYNWRTDPKIAPGGYFDDLASHGLDLFAFLLGDYREASGVTANQQALYGAPDAVSGSWLHHSGVTGCGQWNFACSERRDRVEIQGSTGQLSFSVFDDEAITVDANGGHSQHVVANPDSVQLYHVRNMARHLAGEIQHPSSGLTALHTSWVMSRILGSVHSSTD